PCRRRNSPKRSTRPPPRSAPSTAPARSSEEWAVRSRRDCRCGNCVRSGGMSVTPRILVFGGSLRRGSFNQKLAALAAGKVRDAGGDATLIALRDYPLPLFDADLEEAEGMPAPARALKQLFLDHHGLIISSPEYNSSITGALKNAIDWVSRAESDDEPPLAAFEGK